MRTKADPLANSKLTETILKINPGVDKQAKVQSAKLEKLIKKSARTSDFHRKSVKNDFDSRMEYRKKLYDKMRPKLDDATRARIDKIKEKERKKEAEKLKKEEAERLLRRQSGVRKVEDHSSRWQTEHGAPGHGGHGPGPPTLDWSSDTGPDFSRRSSLKSSIFDLGLARGESPGPLFTENPLGSVIVRRDSSDTKYPEVYLTKAGKDPTPSPRDAQEKLMSFMNLLPAPTPTRFVGKMHKKMIEERKKSEINLLNNKSKPSSRRSSISPSTETIQELKESQSPAPSLRKDSIRKQSITKAAKAISKVGDIARKIKRENSKSDESNSANTPPAKKTTPKTTPKSTPGVSPMSSARASPLMKAKRGGKQKSADKDKAEAKEDTELENESKELKHRIFFVEKKELTDEEVLNELGREAWVPEKNRTNLQGLMKATTIAKRLAKEKKESRAERDTSIIYSGSLRNKLSKDSEKDKGKVLTGTAKFLGKMIHRKDKHGLIVEPPVDGESDGKDENPIIVALDKLNIKLNGRDSKSSRSMSSLSHKNDPVVVTDAAPTQPETSTAGVKASGDSTDGPDVLAVLKGGLCQVTQETIFNWNTNNNDKTDVVLKPIFIPF